MKLKPTARHRFLRRRASNTKAQMETPIRANLNNYHHAITKEQLRPSEQSTLLIG